MNYRINPRNGDKLSILGFGCMRFAKNSGGLGIGINEKEIEEQIIYAIEKGVNFFDTAYLYPNSEEILGRVLAKHNCRDKVKIGTKLPPYLIRRYGDFDKIFNIELKRLQTDYIDYYFIHMVQDEKSWIKLRELGIETWIAEKKAEGKIKNIGFSYHGGRQEFMEVVDVYDWDFCMIQYNYMDEHQQAGKSGLQYAATRGLPVFIMEPLRGGRLVNMLPKEVETTFKNAIPKRSPAEWGLRWVWNHKEVALVLSGMNDMKQVVENIEAASDCEPDSMTESELKMFKEIKEIVHNVIAVPCTYCGYCMPCVGGVDIPTCFACYNTVKLEGKSRAVRTYLMQTTMKATPTNASKCMKCGKCEKHCPQNISIIKELGNVQKSLEGFYYKPLCAVIKKFVR